MEKALTALAFTRFSEADETRFIVFVQGPYPPYYLRCTKHGMDCLAFSAESTDPAMGKNSSLLHPGRRFSILSLREGEDWVTVRCGNVARGKSGLHGQSAG